MSDVNPIHISANSEYDGCTDEQIKKARERLLDMMIDEEIICSRRSCGDMEV